MDGKFVSPLDASGFTYAILSFDKFYPTGRIELVGESETHLRAFLKALRREAAKPLSIGAERGTKYELYKVVGDDSASKEVRIEEAVIKRERPSEQIERLVKPGDFSYS